jgi:hypothetical protein
MYNDPCISGIQYIEARMCAEPLCHHTLRPTASTRRHGPRALAAIISERGRWTFLLILTIIQTDYVIYCWALCTAGCQRGRKAGTRTTDSGPRLGGGLVLDDIALTQRMGRP